MLITFNQQNLLLTVCSLLTPHFNTLSNLTLPPSPSPSPSPSLTKILGVDYCSAENYFQAAKCVNKAEFEKVRRGGCGADVCCHPSPLLFLLLLHLSSLLALPLSLSLSLSLLPLPQVWMVGSMVQLRPDWEPIKVRIMYDGMKE